MGTVKTHAKKTILSLSVVLVAVAFLAGTARAHTATSLAIISVNADQIRNYDFLSQTVSASNVDWAVDLVFSNNATINTVKNGLNGTYGAGASCASGMYGRLNDTGTWVWDTDQGRKTICCPISADSYHYRIYADSDDQMYNTTWGYYVFGTTHIDHNECGANPWSGQSESAEVYLRNHAPSGWTVSANNYWWGNYEPLRVDGSDYWSNDGYATKVRVP